MVIITGEDACAFVKDDVTEAQVDQLSRDELVVLGEYLGFLDMASLNKSSLQNKVKFELFETLPPISDETPLDSRICGDHNGASNISGSEVQSSARATVPPGFTVAQYLELKRLEFEHEYKMAQLKATSNYQSSINSNFVAQYDRYSIKMLPPFVEKDVSEFFTLFEEIASGRKWPKSDWTFIIQPVLLGKARTAFVAATPAIRKDYDSLKKVILDAYQLRPEGYRQKFRKLHQQISQTHIEFMCEMTSIFDKWLQSKGVTDFDSLRALILVENFLWKIDPSVAMYIKEHKMDKLEEVAIFADDYILNVSPYRRKPHYMNQPREPQSPNKSNTNAKFSENFQFETIKPRETETASTNQNFTRGNKQRSDDGCSYCGKRGHTAPICWKKQKDERSQAKPVNLAYPLSETPKTEAPREGTGLGQDEIEYVKVGGKVVPKLVLSNCSPDNPLPEFESFLADASVKINNKVFPVKLYRDTGAFQSVMFNPTGQKLNPSKYVLVGCVHRCEKPTPLVDVELQFGPFSGVKSVGLLEYQPLPGIDFLLGNDIAGGKIATNPVVSVSPVVESSTRKLEQKFPETFPVCAVTRSIARARLTKPTNPDTPDVSSGPLSDSVGTVDAICDAGEKSTVEDEVSLDLNVLFDLPGGAIPHNKELLGATQLTNLQRKDPECSSLLEKAVSEEESKKELKECFFMRRDILHRRWKPSDLPADDGAWDVEQVVVPKELREEILNIAHSSTLSGHMGPASQPAPVPVVPRDPVKPYRASSRLFHSLVLPLLIVRTEGVLVGLNMVYGHNSKFAKARLGKRESVKVWWCLAVVLGVVVTGDYSEALPFIGKLTRIPQVSGLIPPSNPFRDCCWGES
ncbi:hypothetical protein Pmani_003259 [Petrolisthes manimaculis]|uniref:SCAN box domain-containing protein n=1 Tax=Petrolisthes manimaculis TaxID=1843537 RepID=A0AAE1QG67_9EUCA|nr:hypothetical protein Pmani_003259 [Petrolisthes manimaculis]